MKALLYFTLLLFNVLKKEVVLAKGIPIIKVCVAGSDVKPATVRFAREKGKPGRTEEICGEGRGRTTRQED